MANRALGVLVMWVLGAAPAAAQPQLGWEAPPGCPSVDEVRARIEHRLGAPFELYGIEIVIEPDGAQLLAHVDTRAVTVVNQIRELRSASCDELADAVAVVIARLASEIGRAARPSPPAAVSRTLAPPPPAPRREARWGGGVRLLGLSGVGSVPQVGLGGELGGYVRRHRTFGEVALARWATRPSYLVMGAPGRVEVGLDTVAIRAGWAPPERPLRAWLGAELGRMAGAGIALDGAQRGASRWTAVTAGFNVGWPMHPRARLVGTFEVAGVLTRPRFALAEGGEIYRPSPVAARCALGLELGWQ